MRYIKRIKAVRLVIYIFLCILLGICVAGNVEEVKASVENAKKNVFRITTLGKCEDKEYKIKTGTCFLVGNISREQNQYIMTTNHVLTVTEKEKKQIKKNNKLKKDAQIEVVYRVTVSDDIALEASVYNQAQSDDYAILQLSSSLADRLGIPLGDMGQIKDDISLYVLGYDTAGYKINTYTCRLDDRNSNLEKLVYGNNAMKESDMGAPVLDEEGNLLGISVAMDDNAGYAVAVNKLKSSFQTLNVEFESSDSKFDLLKEKILDAKELIKKDDIYSAESLQELSKVLEQAEKVFEDTKAANLEYENQIHALEAAIKNLSEKGSANKIIIIVLAGLITATGITVVIVLLRERKKAGKVHYMNEESVPAATPPEPVLPQPSMESVPPMAVPPTAPPMAVPPAAPSMAVPPAAPSMAVPPKAPPKSVSTVPPRNIPPAAPSRGVQTGDQGAHIYLVSKTTGEKIGITNNKFVIGTQRGAVNYVISGQSSVSRTHAEITMQNGGFYIRDLDSTNHTYVNGKMVQKNTRKRINNADIIRFANVEYMVVVK